MAHRDIFIIPVRSAADWKKKGATPTQVVETGQMGNGDTCTCHWTVPPGAARGVMDIFESPDLGGVGVFTIRKPNGNTETRKDTQEALFGCTKPGDYAVDLKLTISDGTTNYKFSLGLTFP